MINWPIEIIENKYSRWYEQLINKARNRGTIDGYTETHHVIPRSFGGDNTKQNLVKLTAREHYVAHALLWKMSFSPLHHGKMSYALRLMMFGANNKHQQRNYKCHSRLYESVRIEFSQDHSKNMTGENNSFYGRKHTEDSIRKALQTKKETGNYGNKFQPGHKMSKETIRKISIAKKGQTWDKIHSPEELLIRKQKRSEDTRIRNTGQVFSEERKRKISEKMKGRVAHNKGVKGVIKQSPDTVAKRLATIKARGVTTHNKVIKICEHCNQEVKLNVYSRWHGDNCKSLSSNTNSLS
jgi:hypothetical protein